MMNQINELLNETLVAEITLKNDAIKNSIEQQGIILFGSGNLGRKIASYFKSRSYKIECFVDNNDKKNNTIIDDIVVYSPKTAFEKFGTRNFTWVVTIWSPGHSFKKTFEQLNQLGVQNIVPVNNIFQIFSEDLLPYYHFQAPNYYYNNIAKINDAFSCLKDEESKAQYCKHLKTRIGYSFNELPEATTYNQYFPEDIIQLSEPEIFLDCGAYTGDTLNDYLKYAKVPFKKYICLEPDPQNLIALNKNISSKNLTNVQVLEIAVGNENAVLKFDATGGGGAGLSNTGSISVECKRIDDYFNEEITFIKFDIEGAELSALKGAYNTIHKYKPKLAVCIYHLPNDLWEIILYIKEQFPFYDLSVRTHQYDGLDFVLYAIPNSK
jgi:FkbM family methyltransferase